MKAGLRANGDFKEQRMHKLSVRWDGSPYKHGGPKHLWSASQRRRVSSNMTVELILKTIRAWDSSAFLLSVFLHPPRCHSNAGVHLPQTWNSWQTRKSPVMRSVEEARDRGQGSGFVGRPGTSEGLKRTWRRTCFCARSCFSFLCQRHTRTHTHTDT